MLRKNGKIYKLPLLWLLAGPVVAALTLDDLPNINRSSVMFPIIEMIAALGIISFISNVTKNKKRIAIFLVFLLFLANFYYFLFQYFVNAKYQNPWYRNNGFSQVMSIVNKEYSNVDSIIMTKHQGGIYPLVLFYSKYDPHLYQLEGSPKTNDYKGIGKIIFVPQDCPFAQFDNRFPNVKRKLYIDDGNCPDVKTLKYRQYKYIYREDGTRAFRIVYDYTD
jgi:hypothetical protein